MHRQAQPVGGGVERSAEACGDLIVRPPLVHSNGEAALLFAHPHLPVLLRRRQLVRLHDDAILHVLEELGNVQQRLVLSLQRARGSAGNGGRRVGGHHLHVGGGGGPGGRRWVGLEDEDISALELALLESLAAHEWLEAHGRLELDLLEDSNLLLGRQRAGAAQLRHEVLEHVVHRGDVRAERL